MTVRYERQGETSVLITLNRPQQLNAINGAMRADLLDAVCRASADASIRAVVITGEGRGFCAGADLGDGSGGRLVEDVLNAEYAAFLSVIQTCDKPVIAAINGPAAGIGMTLALTCDLRVMSSDAYLMSAFANIGLVPDGGLSWLLTQEIGYARAFQLCAEAEKISAERALAFGLINRVAPSERTVTEALEWAASFSHRAPLAVAGTKRTFRAAAQSGLKNAMAFEAFVQRDLLLTDDCKEGVMALFAKRKPAFKGR